MPALEEDIAAAVDYLGVRNVGLIWELGNHNWSSAQERDTFLRAVKNMGVDTSGR